MEKMDVSYFAMLSMTAEMVLDEAVQKFNEQRLQMEIDRALEQGDKVRFYSLTNELKKLKKPVVHVPESEE